MAINFMFLGVSSKEVCLNGSKDANFSFLIDGLVSRGIDTSSFYYIHNGSPVEDFSCPLALTQCEENSNVVIIRGYSRLFGGKGGFGALIRAMGMRMNRNRNKDACRDLSGRRLRSVNVEKKLAELMKKEPEKRRKEAEEKAEKRRLMLEGPRHQFCDKEYYEQLETTQDEFEDALKQGLTSTAASSSGSSSSSNGGASIGGKRKTTCTDSQKGESKRPKMWIGDEEFEDSDMTDSEDDEEDINEAAQPIAVVVEHEDEIPSIQPVVMTSDSVTPIISPSLPVVMATDLQSDTSTSKHSITSDNLDQTNHTPSSNPQEQKISTTEEDTKAAEEEKDTSFSCEKFDLDDYQSIEELEKIGAEHLKTVLQNKGLKCGGTPHERAVRLWSIRGKELKDIDPSLFASGNGSRGGRARRKGKNKQ